MGPQRSEAARCLHCAWALWAILGVTTKLMPAANKVEIAGGAPLTSTGANAETMMHWEKYRLAKGQQEKRRWPSFAKNAKLRAWPQPPVRDLGWAGCASAPGHKTRRRSLFMIRQCSGCC